MLIKTRPIQTTNKIISVRGKVFYNDRRRRIDIKRPIRDLFEESTLKVWYTMELCLSEEKTLKRVRTLCDENIIPVLMYFDVEEATTE